MTEEEKNKDFKRLLAAVRKGHIGKIGALTIAFSWGWRLGHESCMKDRIRDAMERNPR